MLTAFAPFPFYLLGLRRRTFLYVGLVLQTAYIISRGLELGRLPLVGPHDTLIFLSASFVAFFIPFSMVMKNNPRLFRGIVLVAGRDRCLCEGPQGLPRKIGPRGTKQGTGCFLGIHRRYFIYDRNGRSSHAQDETGVGGMIDAGPQSGNSGPSSPLPEMTSNAAFLSSCFTRTFISPIFPIFTG